MTHQSAAQPVEDSVQKAVKRWVHTPVSKMHELIGDGEDLYLKLVALAMGQPYHVVQAFYVLEDSYVLKLRGLVHKYIQAVLHCAPAGIVQTLDDAVLAHEAVKSSDA